MATGDIRNNSLKLLSRLKEMKYPQLEMLRELLSNDQELNYIEICGYAFTLFNPDFAEWIALNCNTSFFGKTGKAFTDLLYKILRDVFNYKPPLNKDQFLSPGFKEKKMIMTTQILEMVMAKCSRHVMTGGRKHRLMKTSNKLMKTRSLSNVAQETAVASKPSKIKSASTTAIQKSEKIDIINEENVLLIPNCKTETAVASEPSKIKSASTTAIQKSDKIDIINEENVLLIPNCKTDLHLQVKTNAPEKKERRVAETDLEINHQIVVEQLQKVESHNQVMMKYLNFLNEKYENQQKKIELCVAQINLLGLNIKDLDNKINFTMNHCPIHYLPYANECTCNVPAADLHF